MAAAMKLGELLVQEGVISPHQLEEALKYQVIFGGKLGTNLIELDFVREDDIAKTLSRMLRVPLVSGEELQNIPDDVINLIPRDISEQYQVVPLQLDHRKLTLVMANPSDLKAIDEISFRTGFIVRPAVAAEVRLILALEKYYHIPREIRYVQVSKKVEGDLDAPSPDKVGNEVIPEQVPAEAAPNLKKAELAQKKREDAKKAADAKVQAEKKAAAEAEAKKIAEEAIEAIEEIEEIEEVEEVTAEPLPAAEKKPARTIKFEDDDDTDEPVAAEPVPEKKQPEPVVEEVVELPEADIIEEGSEDIDSYPIEEVFKHLADPADREDIADSLIGHLGHDVDRAALFQIRGEVVQGWKLFVDDKPVTDFGMFQVTLDHPSILKTVIDTASYYIGPIPKTSPDNMRLVDLMGGNPPTTALLVPVIVMGRVVTVIYIDDKKADLPAKLLELQKLAAKMAMSFEILILKNKILMM
jgi:hypothetical protein